MEHHGGAGLATGKRLFQRADDEVRVVQFQPAGVPTMTRDPAIDHGVGWRIEDPLAQAAHREDLKNPAPNLRGVRNQKDHDPVAFAEAQRFKMRVLQLPSLAALAAPGEQPDRGVDPATVVADPPADAASPLSHDLTPTIDPFRFRGEPPPWRPPPAASSPVRSTTADPRTCRGGTKAGWSSPGT